MEWEDDSKLRASEAFESLTRNVVEYLDERRCERCAESTFHAWVGLKFNQDRLARIFSLIDHQHSINLLSKCFETFVKHARDEIEEKNDAAVRFRRIFVLQTVLCYWGEIRRLEIEASRVQACELLSVFVENQRLQDAWEAFGCRLRWKKLKQEARELCDFIASKSRVAVMKEWSELSAWRDRLRPALLQLGKQKDKHRKRFALVAFSRLMFGGPRVLEMQDVLACKHVFFALRDFVEEMEETLERRFLKGKLKSWCLLTKTLQANRRYFNRHCKAWKEIRLHSFAKHVLNRWRSFCREEADREEDLTCLFEYHNKDLYINHRVMLKVMEEWLATCLELHMRRNNIANSFSDKLIKRKVVKTWARISSSIQSHRSSCLQFVARFRAVMQGAFGAWLLSHTLARFAEGCAGEREEFAGRRREGQEITKRVEQRCKVRVLLGWRAVRLHRIVEEMRVWKRRRSVFEAFQCWSLVLCEAEVLYRDQWEEAGRRCGRRRKRWLLDGCVQYMRNVRQREGEMELSVEVYRRCHCRAAVDQRAAGGEEQEDQQQAGEKSPPPPCPPVEQEGARREGKGLRSVAEEPAGGGKEEPGSGGMEEEGGVVQRAERPPVLPRPPAGRQLAQDASPAGEEACAAHVEGVEGPGGGCEEVEKGVECVCEDGAETSYQVLVDKL
eukprot:746293-Hanusia_phi.AAC.4